MKRTIWILLAATTAFAQKREDFLNLSRDVGLIHDRLLAMEKAQGEKLESLEKLIQTAIDNQSKITGSLSNLQTGLAGSQKTIITMGSKVDSMATDTSTVQTSLAELNAQIRKMQAQMTDMANAIKVLQAPPAPPAPDGSTPPAGMTADALYQNALRAKSAGQYDLASQQFNDYLKYFGQTDLAADAQYYLGEIATSQGRNDDAIAAFDQVAERYPDNRRTLDAMYMKGVVLTRAGRKADAAAEFRALIKKAPASEQADKARDQMKRLTAAPSAKKK